MTISSSLNAGVAGLSVNASRLATIADNIANSATYGYKRSVADFHSMVISNGNGSYSAGGVRVTTQKLVDQRGALLTTDNSTDLAVRGRGFLPVTTGAAVDNGTGDYPLFMTTTGSFRTDEDGFLRTPTGVTLLGVKADSEGRIPNFARDTKANLEPVQINVNQFTSEPTDRITFGLNLPAVDTLASNDWTTPIAQLRRELSIEYFDNLGTSQSLNVTFTPVDPADTGAPNNDPTTLPLPASNTWVMEMTDSATDSGTTPIARYVLVFDDSREDGGLLANVYRDIGDAPVPSPTTFNPFMLDALQPGGSQPFTPLPVAASGNPSAWDAASGIINVDVDGGPIAIDIGAQLTPGGGMSQLSSSFAPTAISKNGSPVGNLTSVEVDANGFVRANFDVGITRTVFQIPLMDVPNPNGLMAHDNQLYSPSDSSGSFFLWDAADGPTGDIVGFALEESTTDVAGELTQLIQTQRAYSSNAKIITTVDEMLQETTNMKR
jgi:flagellar hook protein FlgE